MVQLIALGLVGGLAWYAFNTLQKHMSKVGEELDKNEKKSAKPKTSQTDTLELGEDGVYRPQGDKPKSGESSD